VFLDWQEKSENIFLGCRQKVVDKVREFDTFISVAKRNAEPNKQTNKPNNTHQL
jgi:hypothetical protein